MKRNLAAVCVGTFLALFASAAVAGVRRAPVAPPEFSLWTAYPSAAMSASADYGGHKLPASRGFTVTGVACRVSSAGGGGAGNSLITISDGTNTCTATFLCTTTASGGNYRVAAVNGSGTGCVYPVGAGLNAVVTSSSCTTTQPTVKNCTVVGYWN